MHAMISRSLFRSRSRSLSLSLSLSLALSLSPSLALSLALSFSLTLSLSLYYFRDVTVLTDSTLSTWESNYRLAEVSRALTDSLHLF